MQSHRPTIAREELVALYQSVGWTAYTRDPDALERAVAASTWVAAARGDGALIGLIRVLSDDVAIALVQDLLVRPDHQRTGVGRGLLRQALARFDHVRSIALITDDEPRQHAFYRSLGLVDLREVAGGRLHAFVRAPRG
jgi:GNAT superfamily N-acetyltransferase